MKKQLFMVFLALGAFSSAYSGWTSTDPWVKPNEGLTLDQAHFLGSHNSFTNIKGKNRWQYGQQNWTIQKQLENGVRSFMLDIHKHKRTAYMCHGDKGKACSGFMASFQKSDMKWNTFKSALETIKTWMGQNPREIVTVILEQYVSNDMVDTIVDSVSGLAPMVLTKNDWDPHQHGGQWPTLKWMADNNKRLIIWGKGFSKYNRKQWAETTESDYSTTKISKVCKQRSGSRKNADKRDGINALSVLNFFEKISDAKASKKHNTYSKLKELYTTCSRDHNLLPGGKPPFTLALDFVDVGNPMKLINEWNAQAAAQLGAPVVTPKPLGAPITAPTPSKTPSPFGEYTTMPTVPGEEIPGGTPSPFGEYTTMPTVPGEEIPQ